MVAGFRLMRRYLGHALPVLAAGVFLGGCAAVAPLEHEVSQEPVPTAMFVFFEHESTTTVEGSDAVFERAAAVLNVFDNIGVKLVGHRAANEAAQVDGVRIDEARLAVLTDQMRKRGVSRQIISRLAQGVAENMAAQAGGDESVDRRGEMIFGPMPAQ